MDSELVDRIYESSFVPELWPDVLDDVGRIAEARGGSLFVTNADVTSWTANKAVHEATATFVKEGWFWRGQIVSRLFAACHAGFLTELDFFTPDEMDREPIYRDMWRPRGVGWQLRQRFQSQREKS
jgi:hypothetical protein